MTIDTTSATGRCQLQLLGALAELERGLIQERTRAGLEAARARGRTGGRPPAVTKRTLAAAHAKLEQRELTMSEIAAELGVGRSTLNRHLARHRAEKDGRAKVVAKSRTGAAVAGDSRGRPGHSDGNGYC